MLIGKYLTLLLNTQKLNNVLHKTSSGIGSSTLSTAKNLINCTALTYTTETAIGFMRCYTQAFMKFETYLQPEETKIWAKYAEKFKDCNSIFETHFNGVALLQVFEKENDKDFLILSKVTKLFGCEKQMYDWSYYSFRNIISENCRVIRENVIANYPPQEIEKWAFKIDTRMTIEALSYACV